MPTRFPVTFQTRAGRAVIRPHEGDPVIEVYFHRPSPLDTEFTTLPYKALIDTGSQLNCACPELLERHGCPLERSMVVQGVTGNADTHLYAGMIYVPEHRNGLNTQFIALESLRGQHIPLILGSLFMQQGHLSLNHVTGEHWFDYHSASERALHPRRW
jgi:hypothetical protein